MAELNIYTDELLKKQAELLFSELGLSVNAAVNLFLKTAVREQAIPFQIKIDVPNNETAAAVEEGRRLGRDINAHGYADVKDLSDALEI